MCSIIYKLLINDGSTIFIYFVGIFWKTDSELFYNIIVMNCNKNMALQEWHWSSRRYWRRTVLTTSICTNFYYLVCLVGRYVEHWYFCMQCEEKIWLLGDKFISFLLINWMKFYVIQRRCICLFIAFFPYWLIDWFSTNAYISIQKIQQEMQI